ncbi:MAG: histidine--tRNA ligase [Myxococcota bacterium]
MELRAVRGMRDILPPESWDWQWLESRFREIAERYGFAEARTPLLEATPLFVREIGAGTDVVDKEMYSFERHRDQLTVRPEGTAGAARAYVQNAVSGREPVTRWYYVGPMFRAERPAKGRYRQFHQAGCEIYGDEGPLCDAELIALCVDVITALGLDDCRIHLNSLGSGDTRARYRDALTAYFEPRRAELSEVSQRRVHDNPLRILDSKSEADQKVAADAPSVLGLLDDEDRAHFERLQGHLDDLEIPYVVDPTLVRGLDYYTRTLFELKTTTDTLGAQSTLIGGGRYDRMVQSLGHKSPVPAIGFAMGLERLLTLATPPATAPRLACYVAPLRPEAHGVALRVVTRLRRAGHHCELDGRGGSLKAMLRRANGMGGRLCLLIGEDELATGSVTIKDLARHEQQTVTLDDGFVARVQARLDDDDDGSGASGAETAG